MFAVQYDRFGGPEVLHLGTAETPQPGPGQIRVRVHAAGISPVDVGLRSGRTPMSAQLPLPHIPASTPPASSTRSATASTPWPSATTSSASSSWQSLGGATAEFAVLQLWAHKPTTMPWTQAGAAGTSIETASLALDLLDLRPGMRFLVNGAAGGVGSIAVRTRHSPRRAGHRHRTPRKSRPPPPARGHTGHLRARTGRPGQRLRHRACGPRTGRRRRRISHRTTEADRRPGSSGDPRRLQRPRPRRPPVHGTTGRRTRRPPRPTRRSRVVHRGPGHGADRSSLPHREGGRRASGSRARIPPRQDRHNHRSRPGHGAQAPASTSDNGAATSPRSRNPVRMCGSASSVIAAFASVTCMITTEPGRTLSSTARTNGFHAVANGSPLTTSPSTTVTPSGARASRRRRVVAQPRKTEVPGLPTPVRLDHLERPRHVVRQRTDGQPGQVVAVIGERRVPVRVVGQLEARVAGDPPRDVRIPLHPLAGQEEGRRHLLPLQQVEDAQVGVRLHPSGAQVLQHPVGHVRVERQRHFGTGTRPVIHHRRPGPHPRRPGNTLRGGGNRRRRTSRRWRRRRPTARPERPTNRRRPAGPAAAPATPSTRSCRQRRPRAERQTTTDGAAVGSRRRSSQTRKRLSAPAPPPDHLMPGDEPARRGGVAPASDIPQSHIHTSQVYGSQRHCHPRAPRPLPGSGHEVQRSRARRASPRNLRPNRRAGRT